MRSALALIIFVVSSSCVATKGQLINGPTTLTTEASPTCADVVIRRTALGARWGEFLRVRIEQTDAVIVGQAALRVGSKVEKEKAFFVSGKELVLESKWSNEKLDVMSALPRGATLEVTLRDLTAAAGRCENVKFDVEQGALTPDIEEQAWIVQLGGGVASKSPSVPNARKPVPPPPARRATPKTASNEAEWATWAGRNADLDTSEWEPWPLASRFTAPKSGTPLSKGVWLAWNAQPAASQRNARVLAVKYKLPAPESPEQMSALVDRVRSLERSDDDAVFTLMGRTDGAALALSLSTAFGLGWPVPDLTEVTSPYGMRTHPILGGERLHTGIDLSVPEGTPIIATGSGIVIRAGETKVNGRYVIIDHGHGVTTAYLHNSKLLVVEGQRVSPGDFVSLSGNTGRSTGPHLHYQLEIAQQTVDPLFFRPEPMLRDARAGR